MPRQLWAVLAAGLVLAVYASVLWIMPKDGFWSPDEGAKFIQLHSLEWHDGLRYAIPYGGQRVDPEFAFYPTRCRFEDLYPVPLADGGVKFHWPIWFPLGSGLLVSAFGLTGLYLVPALSGCLVALIAGQLVRAWDARLMPLAVLAVGLATPVAFFSLTFWEHTLATLLGLAGLAAVSSGWPSRTAAPWLAAPLLLAAAALRLEMLLFAFAVLGAWFAAGRLAHPADASPGSGTGAARRRWSSVVLGVAIAVVLTLVALLALPARHLWTLHELPAFLAGTIVKLPHVGETLTSLLIDAPGNQAPVTPDLWRYAVLLACLATAAAPLLRSRRAEGIALAVGLAVLLEFSVYLIARPQAYVSLHGFLPVAPFIILAVYALVPAWQRRQYAQVAVAGAAVLYALFAFLTVFVFLASPNGVLPTGLEWGSRYLFTLYPVGAVLALAALYEYRRAARPPLLKRAVAAAAALLLLCGVLLQARGVWTLIESRRLVAAWQAALRDGPPVVTDVWWLPAVMAPLFISHEVHCVQAGRLDEWLPIAQQHGVDTFTFASFRAFPGGHVRHPGFELSTDGERIVSGLHLTQVRIAPAAGGVTTDR